MNLIVVILLTIFFIPLIYWEPSNFLRIILGLFLILLFPGYALVESLFPRKNDLDGTERIALAIGLSLALIPILGLILNFSPWGIQFGSILFASSLWILAFSLLGIYRRRISNENDSIKVDFLRTKTWIIQHRRPPNVAVIGSIIIASIILISTVSWRIQSPPAGEPFTEFYILGETRMLQDYPTNLSLGSTQNYWIGIINNEGTETSYSVKAFIKEESVGGKTGIRLGAGDKWEDEFGIVPRVEGTQEKLVFELYRENEENPYRKLHLFVDIN